MTRKNADLTSKVRRFITDNRTGSLATVSEDGVPHVAYVFCVVDDDLTLYFMSRVEGRKFSNLMSQPTVAMSFINDMNMETVHLTGRAERVNDLNLEQLVWSDLMKFRIPWADKGPVPAVQLFERGATNELAIIKVVPFEMTFAKYQQTGTGRYRPFWQKVM